MANPQTLELADSVESCTCFTKAEEMRAHLAALEHANENLQKKLDGFVRDNENLVIKYAFVEKKVIDLKAMVGEKDGRIKRYDQEIAVLQKQIGLLKAEKQKLQKNIESKQTGAEESQQSAEHMVEMERKVMELQAREIMLKHANYEQGIQIVALQKLNAEQRENLEKQLKNFNNSMHMLKVSQAENEQLSLQIKQLQDTLDRQDKHISTLGSELSIATIAVQQSSRMESLLITQGTELEQLTLQLDEHKNDIESVKSRELELLALNKDLSEVNCLLQKEITKQEANRIAITLEYSKFVKMCQEYDTQIVSLANSLALERQQRAEERLLMAKHIADKTRKLVQAEETLQQTLNELEAYRKKNYSLMKDFKREMKHFRQDPETTTTNHDL